MEIVITGTGLLTSVGHDAPTSCASIRAAISRPAEHPTFRVLDDETQDLLPVTAHPITCFLEGYYLVGLWLRAGGRVLAQALADAGLADVEAPDRWRRTALYAVVPHIDDARYLGTAETDASFLVDAYLAPLVARAGIALAPERLRLVAHGHAGAFHALAEATDALRAGELDRALIVAVDSQLDSLTLDWLADEGRLKTADRPTGLAPGEAAGALVVERAADAARRGVTGVTLAGVATGREERHLGQDEPNLGAGLADALERLWAQAGGPVPFRGDLIVDLNGETWRAREFGHAQYRLPWLHEPRRLVLPATSVGDVGVGAGVVNLGVATAALRRAWAAPDGVLVTGSSERGAVGAAWVRSNAGEPS